jgi:lauroyl/myristoyl acyltransferase
VVEQAMADELTSRPWYARRRPLPGIEALLRATSGGGGAVLAFCHLGPQACLWENLAAQGLEIDLVWKRPRRLPEGSAGIRIAGIADRLERDGWTFHRPGGLFPQLTELLGRGRICMLAIDTGRRDLAAVDGTFLGPAVFREGPARLACDAGVPLFPAFCLRRRGGLRMWLQDPLDPAAFAGPDSMTTAAAELFREVMAPHLGQLYPHRVLTRTVMLEREAAQQTKDQRHAERARARTRRRAEKKRHSEEP